MADGRIIAHGAGDTTTGAFTCVVRRASLRDRLRYRISFKNACDAAADLTLTRGNSPLQSLRVPARTDVELIFVFPPAEDAARMAIDIRCDGTSMHVAEHPAAAPGVEAETRRLIVLAATAAGGTATAVMLVALLVWQLLRRRAARTADRAQPAPIADAGNLIAPVFAPQPPEPEPEPEPTPPSQAELARKTELWRAAEIERAAELEPAFVPEPETASEESDADAESGTYYPATIAELGPAPAAAEPGAEASPLAVAEVLDPEPQRAAQERPHGGVTYEAGVARRQSPWPAIIAAVVAVGLGGVAFVVAHPHIGELGVPDDVLQGSAIDAPYSTSGWGTLRYAVTSSDGATIAGGDLERRSGVLHIPIPVSAHDQAYRVRLALSGPLGDASNEATIKAHAVPQPRIITRVTPFPRIRSFAVTRSGAGARASIGAFYDVVADSGQLQLIDARGISYGSAPVDASGEAHFPLPDGVDPGSLAVVLHVVRGGVTADSRIALPAGNSGVAVAHAAPAAAAGGDEAPIVVPATAVGRAPIRVQIVRHYPDLHVALVDGSARKLTGVVVGPTSHVVLLPHPPVAVATRITVEATYRMNNESDTVIRPVVLMPAAGG